MKMKMKKMILLILTLLIWGVASMNAQVRIGGTIDPDPSAMLDLNKTNDASPTGNLGLALPRVGLLSTTHQLGGQNPKNGTLVWNTGSGANGVWCWITDKWVKLTVNPVTSADILDGTIVNADVAANSLSVTRLYPAGTNNYVIKTVDGNPIWAPVLPNGSTVNSTLVWNGSDWTPKAPGLAPGTTMWFPSFVLPWTSGAANQTQNLATIFNANFSAQAAVLGAATDYNYFVTSFSNNISSPSITGTTLTYTCTTTAPTATSFVNILMVKK
jgi:hypothetical protein